MNNDITQETTQQMLLEHGMTMNPDYICMAEVKGSEAFEMMEAALTGHPTIYADRSEILDGSVGGNHG